MTDTGSRLALLPPCLACGLDDFIVWDGPAGDWLVSIDLLGLPLVDVTEEHAILCYAAGLLLSWWAADGSRSIRLETREDEPPRLWPEALPPAHVTGWAIDDADAAEALVATVLLGATYKGWERALRIAQRGMAVPGRRAA